MYGRIIMLLYVLYYIICSKYNIIYNLSRHNIVIDSLLFSISSVQCIKKYNRLTAICNNKCNNLYK